MFLPIIKTSYNNHNHPSSNKSLIFYKKLIYLIYFSNAFKHYIIIPNFNIIYYISCSILTNHLPVSKVFSTSCTKLDNKSRKKKFQFVASSTLCRTHVNYMLKMPLINSSKILATDFLVYKTKNISLIDHHPTKEALQWIREARKKLFRKALAKVFKKRFFSFVNKLLINFFQFILNLKVHISFKKLVKPLKTLLRYREFKLMMFQVKRYIRKIKSFKFIENLYKVLWLSLKLKDSNFFLKWFANRIERFPFRMHRYIPYLLTIILKKFSKRVFKQTSTLGLTLSLRGKISVTGDAKKRHSDVRSGIYSNANKSIRLSFARSCIRTKTGVLGVSFGIYF